MSQTDPENGMRREVMAAIAAGKASMRPKWHFVLTGALFVTGVLIALCVVLYLASFTVFSMRETGAWSAPAFGMDGLAPFLRALPLTLITLSLVFVLVLEALVRRYSFAYRTPLLYSLLAILIIVAIASPFIAPFHRAPFQAARKGKLRVAGQLYRRFAPPRAKNIRHGTVESLVMGGFVLRDIADATSLVLVAPGTRLPNDRPFEIGETVTIFGIEDEGGIRAQAARADGF